MNLQKREVFRAEKRAFRTRKKFVSRGLMPRVTVFRSLKNMYVQIVDDSQGKTLLSSSTLTLAEISGDKKEAAKQVGIDLGKKAVAAGITKIFFDRGRFLYHGRVQALAEGLRESGLVF
ncbi:MAG: 50S ribosomal protein L18 [bacterium]